MNKGNGEYKNGKEHPRIQPESRPEPEQLSITLNALSKLGSIAVHARDFLNNGGGSVDLIALRALLGDPEVEKLLEELQGYELIPIK